MKEICGVLEFSYSVFDRAGVADRGPTIVPPDRSRLSGGSFHLSGGLLRLDLKHVKNTNYDYIIPSRRYGYDPIKFNIKK